MNTLLFGFDKDIYEEFLSSDLNIKVNITSGMKGFFHDEGGVKHYNHVALKRADVSPVFPKNIPESLIDRALLKNYPVILRSIMRMERSPMDASRTWADRVHEMYIMFYFYYNLIKSHNIDLIIFQTMPHIKTNISLYFLAKEMGVRTIIAYQTLFPNRFFLMEDFRDLGLFRTSAKTGVKTDIRINDRPEAPFYMHGIETAWDIRKRLMLMQAARLVDPAIKIFTGKDKRKTRTRLIHTLRQRLQMMKVQEKKGVDIDLSRPYVYFPLHLQPELTIDVFGDEFADQLSAVEALRRILPDNVHIYVKENPKQTLFAREDYFFKRLAAIPNTTYVNFNVDTYALIRNSLAVATVVGTAGWEAVQMGKPVITFGYAWYRSLPGIFEWQKGIDWQDVLSYEFDKEKLEEALKEIVGYFYEGCVSTPYENLVENFNRSKNARKVVEAIQHHIKKVQIKA